MVDVMTKLTILNVITTEVNLKWSKYTQSTIFYFITLNFQVIAAVPMSKRDIAKGANALIQMPNKNG